MTAMTATVSILSFLLVVAAGALGVTYQQSVKDQKPNASLGTAAYALAFTAAILMFILFIYALATKKTGTYAAMRTQGRDWLRQAGLSAGAVGKGIRSDVMSNFSY